MLSRTEKILLFMFEFGQGKMVRVKYEDIVAGVFKKYPNDFHLKGYPEYPDSGDLIHKPLYDSKKKGYVNAANKVFSLTERGIELVEHLCNITAIDHNVTVDRFSRSTETEFSRIKNLEGFILFVENQKDTLSDNDFYNYLGVTVRTKRNSFIGRLKTVQAVIDELRKRNDNSLALKVADYHDYMTHKYQNIIDFFINN